jgi:hypothetical protein
MPTDHSLQDSAARPETPLDWPRLPRFMFITGTATAGPPITAKRELARRERIQQTAVDLQGQVERLASPFGDGMIYTICQLPSNRAAASFATVMRALYATGVRTVALPIPRRRVAYLINEAEPPTG